MHRGNLCDGCFAVTRSIAACILGDTFGLNVDAGVG